MKNVKHWFRASSKTWADLEERNPKHAEYRMYALSQLNPSGKLCLDAGCGWGRFLKSYVEGNAIRAVGLDLSLENLRRCKGIPRTDLVLGDIEALPFAEGAFDVVSCIAAMERLPSPDRAMKEMSRVAKHRALICTTWSNYNWLNAVRDPLVRARLIGSLRDLIGTLVPRARKERIYRNIGFTRRYISRTHDSSRLGILETRRFPVGYLLVIAERRKMSS